MSEGGVCLRFTRAPHTDRHHFRAYDVIEATTREAYPSICGLLSWCVEASPSTKHAQKVPSAELANLHDSGGLALASPLLSIPCQGLIVPADPADPQSTRRAAHEQQ